MAGFSDAEEQLLQSVTDDRLVNTVIATMQSEPHEVVPIVRPSCPGCP
jgi:hypothetical protein